MLSSGQNSDVSVWNEWKAEMSPWCISLEKVYMHLMKILSNVRNASCKNYQVY